MKISEAAWNIPHVMHIPYDQAAWLVPHIHIPNQNLRFELLTNNKVKQHEKIPFNSYWPNKDYIFGFHPGHVTSTLTRDKSNALELT